MNFSTIIDPYWERARPHVQHVANTALAYAEQTVRLLRDIRDNGVTDDDGRRHVNGIIPPFATPAAAITLAEVPTGQTWELECVALAKSASGGTVLITGNGMLRYGQDPIYTTAPPARFVGPCTIAVSQYAAPPVEVCLQFRVVAQLRPRSTHAAGQRETGIAEFDGQREHAGLHSGVANG